MKGQSMFSIYGIIDFFVYKNGLRSIISIQKNMELYLDKLLRIGWIVCCDFLIRITGGKKWWHWFLCFLFLCSVSFLRQTTLRKTFWLFKTFHGHSFTQKFNSSILFFFIFYFSKIFIFQYISYHEHFCF